jgi:aminoglycoside/choline kinase family phosphotransferase
MQTRQNVLENWINTIHNCANFTLTPLAGDASFRRYFRLNTAQKSMIVMDAPPESEPITPFVTIGNILKNNGVNTPSIEAVEIEQGFVLLQDFGDELFLNVVDTQNADFLYKKSLDTLILMQNCPYEDLPHFGAAFMQQELGLFITWFIDQFLKIKLSNDDKNIIDTLFSTLVTEINKAPQAFIHRDFHSRNLMVIAADPLEIGVLDFQDAMQGPITYDLVSLLKDCYISWPIEQIDAWVEYFYQQSSLVTYFSIEDFRKSFDYCGFQRHLKVLGIFCRLYLRDNKPGYLKDLPLVFKYVVDGLQNYPQLSSFTDFMINKITPVFHKKGL